MRINSIPGRGSIIRFALLVLILATGFGNRYLFVTHHSGFALVTDQKMHYGHAQHLAEKGEFRDGRLVRAPLYTLFLAGLMKLGIEDVDEIRRVQIYLSGLLLLFSFFFIRELAGPNWSLVGLAILSFYPSSITGPWMLLSENLFTLFQVLALILTLRAWKSKSKAMFLLAGIAWGLAALTRSPVLGFAMILAIVNALFVMPRGKRLATTALLLVGLGVTIAPWTIRNAIRHDTFVLIENTGPFNLWLATSKMRIAEFAKEKWQPIPSVRERNRTAVRESLRAIWKEPGFYIKRVPDKWRQFWTDSDRLLVANKYAPPGSLTANFMKVIQWLRVPINRLVVGFALLGICLSYTSRSAMVAAGLVVYMSAIHSIVVSLSRHRDPLIPITVALTVYAFSKLVELARRRMSGSPSHT